jgi:hypothetical protein
MPQLHMKFGELLEHREIKIEKLNVISWYAMKNASFGESGYCGQDESCLRYLHLPENLENVNFDLNLSHPDDDYMLEAYDQTENISDLLTWIKDFGNKGNR